MLGKKKRRPLRRATKLQLAGVAVLAVAGIGTAAYALAPHPAPTNESQGLKDKAEEYGAQVRTEIADSNAAAEEARRVHVTKPLDRSLRVLFSGDSLSDAWYASTQDKGFLGLVSSGLSAKGSMEFVEAHKSGYRVQDVAQRFPVPESVDLAIVELGTNDLAKKTDPTLFQQQYGAYLDSIRAKSPTAQFLCLGVWATPSPTGDAADATISKECEARGGKFLRLSLIYANGISRGPAGVPVFAGTSDITHPNDNGHAEIAKQVLDMITVR